MNEIKLQATVRDVTGSNANKKLRREELVPAVLYQRGEENMLLTLVAKDFEKVVMEAGYTAIVTLEVDGKTKNVMIKDFQRHPYKNMYVHVDLLGVRMDEKLKVSVPVVFLNRDEINVQPSVLIQNITEIEIECLPADIPQQFEIDVQNMQYGDTLLVKDIEAINDDKIEVLVDKEEVLCSLIQPEEEPIEDEEAEAVDAADVEVIGEEPEEGEAEEE